MEELKKGDRIICLNPYGSNDIKGKTGTIVVVQSGYYGVRFDLYNKDLHDLDGSMSNGYGWWFYRHDDIDYLAKISK